MREHNSYTLTLCFIGVASIVYLFLELFRGDISWSGIAVTLAVSSLGYYFIWLPDESYYNFGGCAAFYLLLNNEFDLLILSQLIVMILIGLSKQPKDLFIYWYRFLASFGMFMIGFVLVLPIYNKLEGQINSLLIILIIVSLFNLLNDLLRRGIQISILGFSSLSPPTRNDYWAAAAQTAVTIFVVYRLHLTETYLELAKELVLLGLLIHLYTYLGNKLHVQKQLLAETRASVLNLLQIAGYGVCQVDRDGGIQAANNESELLLSGALGGLKGPPFSAYLDDREPERQDKFLQTLQQALKGQVVTQETHIRTAGGERIPVSLRLAPYIENRQIAGAHILIKKQEKTIE